MARTVSFNQSLVADVAAISPSFEFSMYAQAAVREKLDRDKLDRDLRKRAFVITEHP